MKVSLAAQVMSHMVAEGIYSVVSEGKEQCLHSVVIRSKVTCSNVTYFFVGKCYFSPWPAVTVELPLYL
jgi:hypothetical protein